jgi:hypothetical protein
VAHSIRHQKRNVGRNEEKVRTYLSRLETSLSAPGALHLEVLSTAAARPVEKTALGILQRLILIQKSKNL